MFSFVSYDQGPVGVEEILASLNVRKKHFSAWSQKSGIEVKAVSSLLQRIKEYHHGIYRHSINVARLSGLLARELKFPSVETYTIIIGALLHDIGKITLPHTILDKQGKLSEDEWKLIKEHPGAGADIVSGYNWGQLMEAMLLLHHERLDGKGYHTVSREKIPRAVRIVTLSDAFDAMISPRPYQKQKSLEECWEEIERCSGTQFDPDLLPGFHSVITRNMR